MCNLGKNRPHNDCVYVYDSLNSGTITTKTSEKLASMLQCDQPEIHIVIQSVQQQNNVVDCGVFAIAFTTSLAYGEDPSDIIYDQTVLRSHFLKCLKQEKMETFSRSNRLLRTLKCRYKELSIEVFCLCRLPYKRNAKMAECSKCSQWYHQVCDNIPTIAFTDSNAEYFCQACR